MWDSSGLLVPLKIIVCITNNAYIMGLVHQYFGYRFHILYSNLKNEFIKLGSSQVLKNLVFSLSCIQRGKEKWYSAASVHKWTRETNESLWVIGAFTTVDIRHTFPHCPHFTWLRFLISTLKMWYCTSIVGTLSIDAVLRLQSY